jgi:hypothetical protein
MMRIIVLITALVCGLQGFAQVKVKSVYIEGDKTMYVGNTQTLKATVKPDNAADKSVEWESSDTTVATVDNSGKVSAIKKGSVIITANAADKKSATLAMSIDFDIQSELQQYRSEIASLRLQVENLDASSQSPILLVSYIIGGLAFLLSIVLFFLLLQQKRGFHDNVLNLLVTEKGTRMNDFINNIVKKVPSVTAIDTNQPTQINVKELETIVVRIVRTMQAQNQSAIQTSMSQDAVQSAPAPPIQPIQPQRQVRYADSIKSDSTFNKVTELPTDDTVFELELENSVFAEFTVYEKANGKVIRRPEFLNGCDIQKIGNTTLEVTSGKAQEQGGKWLVTTKANIKIL